MRWFLIAIVMLWAASAAAQESGYLLNPGDVLEISVWKEEGMEKDVLVLPDGMISFPLAGHLSAAGHTAADVQQFIAERLQKYIPDPVITVSVKGLGGNKIFVIGQVRKPGQFLASHQIDVMQALSLAGGLTPFADEDDIKVLRREAGTRTVYEFDYSDVKKGRSLETNILLQSGDVVVVPD